MSYVIEYRSRIHFNPYFWKPPSDAAVQALQAVAFVQPFPVPSLMSSDPEDFSRMHTTTSPDVALGWISEEHFGQIINLEPSRPSLVRQSLEWQSSAGHATSHSESDLTDTFVYAHNGEVVLKVVRAPLPTRPVRRGGDKGQQNHKNRHSRNGSGDIPTSNTPPSLSRAPSVRAAMSPSLNKKASRASMVSRRSSLPSLSRAPSMAAPETRSDTTNLMVVVSGGSLDRLIGILMGGMDVSVSTTDDSGFQTGHSKNLSVDRDAFAKTWWLTFRSFVSAFVFFEVMQISYYDQRI